jgi:hypothetical protein
MPLATGLLLTAEVLAAAAFVGLPVEMTSVELAMAQTLDGSYRASAIATTKMFLLDQLTMLLEQTACNEDGVAAAPLSTLTLTSPAAPTHV